MTSQFFVNPDSLDLGVSRLVALGNNFDNIGKERSNTRNPIFERVFTELGEKIKPRLRAATPKGATSALSASTDFRLIVLAGETQGETEYRLEMIQTARSSGFTYRPITVSGRLPGKIPPALALRDWVQLKWGLSGVKLEQGAFRLARHIGSHGTQRNPYTFDVLKDSFSDIVEAAQQLSQELTINIRNF